MTTASVAPADYFTRGELWNFRSALPPPWQAPAHWEHHHVPLSAGDLAGLRLVMRRGGRAGLSTLHDTLFVCAEVRPRAPCRLRPSRACPAHL